MNTDERIEKYCSYFEAQLQGISLLNIDVPEGELTNVNVPMYQKILLVSILDTLGRARFPDIPRNRERFIRLMKECTDWQDSNRISLPQLSLSLQSTSGLATERLIEEVRRRFGSWQYGRIYRIKEVDPLIDEIIGLADADTERFIRDAEHASLLYTYRNHLVHEFREPGYGMEISDDDTSPYYHGMTPLEGTNSWELVYPRGFFMGIARSVLGNLERHLRDNNLDPYSFYEFGTIWSRR